MRIIKQEVYTFDELSAEAKENVYSYWRNDDYFFYGDDYQESLKAFEKLFRVDVLDWGVDYYSYARLGFNKIEEDVLDLSGVRLMSYLYNNFYDSIYSGKYFRKNYRSKVTKEYCAPLTGVFSDHYLLDIIVEFMDGKHVKSGYTFQALLEDCVDNWLKGFSDDYDYWCSPEAIKEEIEDGDYEFYEDGTRYRG